MEAAELVERIWFFDAAVDQPNVQEAKDRTLDVLSGHRRVRLEDL